MESDPNRVPGEVFQTETALWVNVQCEACGYVLPIALGYADEYPCINCDPDAY